MVLVRANICGALRVYPMHTIYGALRVYPMHNIYGALRVYPMHLMDTDWILLAALRGWAFCVSI